MSKGRARKESAGDATRLRTLVVEDEESFLGLLKAVLTSSGRFAVDDVTTGEEAIEKLKTARFDLVILDHKLPGISGLNVLQWMHEQKLDLPAIVLTGMGSENVAVEMMKLGAYDYVRKIDFDQQFFPVFALGVHERYLFRKDKEERSAQVMDRAQYLALLENLSNSIYSVTQTVNTSLTAVYLTMEDTGSLLQRLPESQVRTELAKNHDEIRHEYEAIATVLKSIVDLTKLMVNRYAEAVGAEQSGQKAASPTEAAREKQPVSVPAKR